MLLNINTSTVSGEEQICDAETNLRIGFAIEMEIVLDRAVDVCTLHNNTNGDAVPFCFVSRQISTASMKFSKTIASTLSARGEAYHNQLSWQ